MRYTICENHLYSKAYSKGKKYVGKRVIVYVLPDYAASRIAKADPKGERHNRIGITATKKLGNAVFRSRTRRIIRAAYEEVRKRQPMKTGFLIVIVARASIQGAKTRHISYDLQTAFERLGLCKSTSGTSTSSDHGA